MKLRKVLLWTGGILLGLLLIVWLGGWGLLKSPFARAKASQELSKMIGMPVEVDSLDVGGSSTSASIRIPDAEAKDNLIKVGSLDTDISLGSLLSGHANPTYVNLKDVDFLLRLNEKGEIISPLPKANTDQKPEAKPLPELKVVNGRVRIRQTGKPEFALGGVTARLHRDGDAYTLDGDVNDPHWGTWKLNGRLTADFADGQVSLTTARTELKDQLLRTIPYVPVEVWDNLQASGPTAATVTFTFQPGKDLGYAVDVKPQKATLGLPVPGVTLTDVQGNILVADGKVTVTDGKVATAGGSGTVSGEYVYWQKGVAGTSAEEPLADIKVKANAAGLDVAKLPEKWGLKKLFLVGGKLKGETEGNDGLRMKIARDGSMETSGGASAEVVDPKLALESGNITEFKLRLRSRGGTFQFEAEEK